MAPRAGGGLVRPAVHRQLYNWPLHPQSLVNNETEAPVAPTTASWQCLIAPFCTRPVLEHIATSTVLYLGSVQRTNCALPILHCAHLSIVVVVRVYHFALLFPVVKINTNVLVKESSAARANFVDAIAIALTCSLELPHHRPWYSLIGFLCCVTN